MRDEPYAVQTVAVMAMLVARTDLSADLVYALTKAMWEGLDRLRAAHAQGRTLDPSRARVGMPIPLHPGAERYYNERGIR